MASRARARQRRTPIGSQYAGAPGVGVALLATVLVLGAIPRLHIVLSDDGVYWPDEIYQSLEPAHRLVFGTGLQAWEFIEGGRNWTFPALVAAVMKLASLVGLDDPRGYIALEKLTFTAVSLATAAAVYWLARVHGASALAAAGGASVVALSAMPMYFAPRALSENAAALPLVAGLALALPRDVPRGRRILGSALVGLAVLFRVQTGIVAVGYVATLFVRRNGYLEALATLSVAALTYGAIDQLTWGAPFSSVINDLGYNARLASEAGSADAAWYYPPATYFATALLSSMTVAFVVAFGFAILGARRAPALAAIATLFVVVHSFIPHKELRFIVPAVPLLAALAAVGVDEFARGDMRARWRAPVAAGVLILAAGISGARFPVLAYEDVGLLIGDALFDQSGAVTVRPRTASAFDFPGPVNRLLVAASRRSDVCGLKVEAVNDPMQGGYTYFNKPVPLYRRSGPGRDTGFFNYVIVWRPQAGQDVRAREGEAALIRLRDGCVPDPAFNERISRMTTALGTDV